MCVPERKPLNKYNQNRREFFTKSEKDKMVEVGVGVGVGGDGAQYLGG